MDRDQPRLSLLQSAESTRRPRADAASERREMATHLGLQPGGETQRGHPLDRRQRPLDGRGRRGGRRVTRRGWIARAALGAERPRALPNSALG
jgi:hypothetical protein